MNRDEEKKTQGSSGLPGPGNGLWMSFLGDALREAASRLGKDLPRRESAERDNEAAGDSTVPEASGILPEVSGTVPDEGYTLPDGSETVPEDGLALPEAAATIPEDLYAMPQDSAALPEPPEKTVPVHVSVPVTDSIRSRERLPETIRVMSAPIKGGMGSVWRVRHTGWNVDLAMKRPKPEHFKTDQEKKAFTDECRNWVNLGLHPNIVSCYYVREIEGVPTIFSEWMENGSLADHIKDGTLYDGTADEVQERLLDIAIQFARGLRYAHENRLVHQDVKPGNLLLGEDWEAKVSDFGLAKARSLLTMPQGSGNGRGADPDATMVTPSGGMTPAYCSPEQAAGGLLTRRTDLYSWAVSVLEMYLGEKPWEHRGEVTGPMVGFVCRDYFAMCRERPVPETLQELLARCMETDPDDRPHDFARVEEELLKIFEKRTGKPYFRPAPEAAADTADSLNNRALSYLDLGLDQNAEECWQRAEEADAMHFDTCINHGLYLWRAAEISDLEMLERIWYMGDLNRFFKDKTRKEAARNVLEQYWDEIRTGEFIPDIAFGKIRAENPLRRQDLSETEFSDMTDLLQVRAEQAVVRTRGQRRKNDYIYSMEAVEERPDASYGTPRQPRKKMLLRIIEPQDGRIRRSIEVEPVRGADPDGAVQEICPNLLADYDKRRLIFVFPDLPQDTGRVYWWSYDMPVMPQRRQGPGYRLSFPKSSREGRQEDLERKACMRKFREAEERDDFEGMLSAYDRIWTLPLTGEREDFLHMNRALMKKCRMPGLYEIPDRNHPGTIMYTERIWRHSPEDPSPAGFYGFLPMKTGRSEDGFSEWADHPEMLRFRDTSSLTCLFYPWAEDPGTPAQSLKALYLDKQEKTLHERVISPELKGKYIRKVLAVSRSGKFLVLELGNTEEPPCGNTPGSRAGSFSIVWLAASGRGTVLDLTDGDGENPYQAIVYEEDQQFHNHRVYLWKPFSNELRYFELDFGRPPAMEERALPVPLPDTLLSYDDRDIFGFDRRNGPRQQILSLVFSEMEEDRMALITCEKKEEYPGDGRRCHFYLYLRSEKERGWQEFFSCSSRERVFFTKDMEYMLIGSRNFRSMCWNYDFWSVEELLKFHLLLRKAGYMQKPVPFWTFSDYSDTCRIDSFSQDMCSILDKKGRPLYAACWKYKPEESRR